jgi:FkbM family methyltransferase
VSWLPPLLRRLARPFRPRRSLAEWEQHHRERVAEGVQRILPYIPEDGILVDVGANIGLFTHYVLKARPGCRAYLFEPVRALYERCVERFAGRPQVVVEQLALAHENSKATIWKARHNPGGNSLVYDLMFDRRAVAEVTEKTVHDEEIVECRVFSEYAREKGIARVDFVKTDTEGFDYRVLEGMLPFLETCEPRPVILAELMREGYHPHWDAQLAIVRRLYGIGYREVDLSRMEKIDDILFLPKTWGGGSRTGE